MADRSRCSFNIIQNDQTRQKFDPLRLLACTGKSPGNHVGDRTNGRSPGSLATAFRREIQSLDPDLPIYGPFAAI